MNSERARIDYVGIGVQKAATSWLFFNIIDHPMVRGALLADNKEMNFFNHNYEKGYAWYHRFFEWGPWCNGEFSVLYFHDCNIPARLHAYNPQLKLIVSLRNPIERAYSQHLHEIKKNRLPEHYFSFKEALSINPSYLEQGLYATHLKRYLEFFPLSQLCIVTYDQVRKDPLATLQQIYSFLGVDSSYVASNFQEKVNTRHVVRSLAVAELFHGSFRMFRGIVGEQRAQALKLSPLAERIRRLNQKPVSPQEVPPLTSEDRTFLGSYYEAEMHELEALVGGRFTHWIDSV